MSKFKLKEQTKAVEEKSDDKPSMQKKIYNRLLKERTSMKKKKTTKKYEDPSDIYDKIKNGDKTIQAAQEEQKNLNQN